MALQSFVPVKYRRVCQLHLSHLSLTIELSFVAGKLGSLILKLGPKYDMGALCPDKNEGWQKAANGKHWCVWIKKDDGVCGE